MSIVQTACVPNTGGIAVYIEQTNGLYAVHVDGHGYHVRAERTLDEAARATANAMWSEIVKRRNEGWSGSELVRAAGALNIAGLITVQAPVTASARPAAVEITEGVWTLGDTTYKVQRAVHGSGHLYAKLLTAHEPVVHDGYDGHVTWSFEYAPGAMSKLRNGGARRLTADEAAKFGKLYGICISCARTLTHERSIEVGYGAKCAENNGWEW